MDAKPYDPSRFKMDYDRATDVLEVLFGTGEPSFSREVDDVLIVDIGMYSHRPTGFQILNASEIKRGRAQLVIKGRLSPLMQQHRQEDREVDAVMCAMEDGDMIEHFLEKVIA